MTGPKSPRSVLAAVLLMAGCTAGSAATLPAPTGSFSPADAKSLAMTCTWRSSLKATYAGLQPLIAQFPVVSDPVTFKSQLDALRRGSDTLTRDPVSGDPWPIVLERRHLRPELQALSKTLSIDSDFVTTLFNDLDAWATRDNLDPTSDLAALLQEEIAGLQPLLSDELGAVLC